MSAFIGECRPEPLVCTAAHLPGCYNPGLDVTACLCGQAWWPRQVGTWHSVERHEPAPALPPMLDVGAGAPGLQDRRVSLGWDTYFLHAPHCPARASEAPCTPCGGAEPTDYHTAVKLTKARAEQAALPRPSALAATCGEVTS